MYTTEYESFIRKLEEALLAYLEAMYTVEIRPVHYLKNNGVIEENLQISLPEHEMGHVIDPQPLFLRYKAGEAMEVLVCEVAESYLAHEPAKIAAVCKMIGDYEKIRDRLFLRVINRDANPMLLSMCPHVIKLDLAVTFHIEVRSDSPGILSMTVDHKIFHLWQISLERLYADALLNTQKRFPGTILSVHKPTDTDADPVVCRCDAAEDMSGTGMRAVAAEDMTGVKMQTADAEDMPAAKMSAADAQGMPVDAEDVMFAITNTKMLNGAAAVFYPGLLQRLAENVGCDLYLMPSSIHEMMAVPVKYWDDPLALKAVVADANATVVSKEACLGDHVYRYSCCDDTFVIVA